MHIQNNDITPATSKNHIRHPINNKLYFLNCRYYSVVYKKSCSQLMIVVSSCIEKNIILWSYSAPFVPPTSCTPTKSNLHLANSLATVVKWTWGLQTPYIPCTKSHAPFPSFRLYQRISLSPRHMYLFRNKVSFYGEELLALRPTPNWKTTPCRLSETAYSIYSQLPSILETFPPSATRGLAMPWWQRPTYHDFNQ